MGPWGGFITGLAESIEYIMTPAVIVFFIGSYLTGIFETPAAYQPLWWIGCYLRVRRAQLLGRRAVVQGLRHRHAAGARGAGRVLDQRHSARRLLALGAEHRRRARTAQPSSCRKAAVAFLPFGWGGVLAALPFAVWLFLAIEELPLAAEESVDPKRTCRRA